MAEQDIFGSLLTGLRGAPGVFPKLRILGNAARSLRRLSPRERGVLLKMAGLGGAEALVERLATGDPKTDQAFRRLLVEIEKHPEELGESVRGLLDPARRAEAASALVHSLDEALNPEQEDEGGDEAPEGDEEGAPEQATGEPASPAAAAAGAVPSPRPELARPAAPAGTGRPMPPPLPSKSASKPSAEPSPKPPAGPPLKPQARPEPRPAAKTETPAEVPAAAKPADQPVPAPTPRPAPRPEPRAEPPLAAAEPIPPPAEEPPASGPTPDPWATQATAKPDRAPLQAVAGVAGATAAVSAVGAGGLARVEIAARRAGADDLLALRRRLAEGTGATLDEIERRLAAEAPTWTRRRTHQAWIESVDPDDLVAGFGRLLALVADLPRPADRLWCLTSLSRGHAWTDEQWRRIVALAGSPALVRRLERLRLRES